MVKKETENFETELIELDDVLDHSFFNEEEDLSDMDDEFDFISDHSEDFRTIDEL